MSHANHVDNTGTDPTGCAAADKFLQDLVDLGRFGGSNESGMRFATYGEVRIRDVFAVAADYAEGVTPEIGVHVRWVKYPHRYTWVHVETTLYRAAYRSDGEPYTDTVHVTLEKGRRVALAEDPAATFTEVTHYI